MLSNILKLLNEMAKADPVGVSNLLTMTVPSNLAMAKHPLVTVQTFLMLNVPIHRLSGLGLVNAVIEAATGQRVMARFDEGRVVEFTEYTGQDLKPFDELKETIRMLTSIAYNHGEISIGRAAELLGTDVQDAQRMLAYEAALFALKAEFPASEVIFELELNDFALTLIDAYEKQDGRHRVRYLFQDKRRLIFNSSVGVPVDKSVDGDDTIFSILSFCADTNTEGYTLDQKEWVEQRGEDLGIVIEELRVTGIPRKD